MIKEWEVVIPSLGGDKKRKVYVYLPVEYNSDSEVRYPVMYMFDGHNLFFDDKASFGKGWGLKDYLDNTKTPLIIASVECNREGNGRLSEYSPIDFIFKNGEKIKGRGGEYLNWLVKEFKPYIDKTFNTLSDREHTAIGGSSMGGLMTLYALAKYNAYFSRGAALSPSLWVYGKIPDFVEKSRFGKNTILYTDYGSKEFKNHSAQRKIFSKTCARLTEKGVLITSRVVPDGVHSEASWEKSIPFFMNVLGFKPYK